MEIQFLRYNRSTSCFASILKRAKDERRRKTTDDENQVSFDEGKEREAVVERDSRRKL
jgi:translation elongation factor EF-1alpha